MTFRGIWSKTIVFANFGILDPQNGYFLPRPPICKFWSWENPKITLGAFEVKHILAIFGICDLQNGHF